MSSCIQSTSGVHRGELKPDVQQHQSQASNLNSKSATVCKPLPSEIWEMIASHLKGADLEHLSLVSSTCKAAALKIKNIQQIHADMAELRDLDLSNLHDQQAVSSVFDVYRNFIWRIRHPRFLPFNPNFAIKPELLEPLQQTLTALFEKTAADLQNLERACYTEIRNNTWCIKCIEDAYNQQTHATITQALHHIISSTEVPLDTRGQAVLSAAAFTNASILTNLLDSGPIGDADIGYALVAAAEKGNEKIVKTLLSRKTINSTFLGSALAVSAQGGHLKVVEALLTLENRGIASYMDLAIENAKRQKHYAIATVLEQKLKSPLTMEKP